MCNVYALDGLLAGLADSMEGEEIRKVQQSKYPTFPGDPSRKCCKLWKDLHLIIGYGV